MSPAAERNERMRRASAGPGRRAGAATFKTLLTAAGVAALGAGSIVGITSVRDPRPPPRVSEIRQAVIALGETNAGTGSALEIAAAASGVWVNLADEIVRVDPSTNRITARLAGPGFHGDIATGFGSLWVADGAGVRQLDPLTGGEIRRISIARPLSIAVGEGAIWVGATGGSPKDVVLRIDPAAGRVTASIEVQPFFAMAVGEDAVWLLSKDRLTRIDAKTNRVVDTIRVEHARGLAVGLGWVWVTHGEPRHHQKTGLVRVDPQTGRIRAGLELGGGALICVGDGRVWVLDFGPHELLAIDPRSVTVVRRTPMDPGRGPPSIAAGAGAVWVSRHLGDEQATIELVRIEV